jgi:hypothetical protein
VAGADSFRQVEIVMLAQDAFNMQFSTRELDSMANVGDFVQGDRGEEFGSGASQFVTGNKQRESFVN